jgi:hypothetical protein
VEPGKSACGGCDTCGSEQRPPAADVSVPLHRVGRRS